MNKYLLLLALALASLSLSSQGVYTWNGTISSDWNTAGNWTPNGIPGAIDEAQITDGAAQIANGARVGFNTDYAPQNAQFVLNLIHWLDDVKIYTGPEHVFSDPEVEAILEQNRALETAFQEDRFYDFGKFYTDDAVAIGNRHTFEGKEAISQNWLNLSGRGISWKLENTAIEVYDNIAIQRGISRMKFLYDGKEQLSEVRFTLVWKKIRGQWLIHVDHYSLL